VKASIIVTNHNYGRFLERCLRSCLRQDLIARDDYEVIVVDDASTDDSVEIAGKFASDGVRIIRRTENGGVAAAANDGIRAAKGQYFVRVDADDFVTSRFLHFLVSYLDLNHDALGVACDYVLVDGHEQQVERVDASLHPVSCGILYQKDLLVAHGIYDPDFRHREEEELRARLGDFYTVHHLRMPLYRYRKHGTNKTTDPEYVDFADRVAEVRARSTGSTGTGSQG
jgi:glycosyltransferase involved in cell wall biosynthesis